MKKIIPSFITQKLTSIAAGILVFFLHTELTAQPANDNCVNAVLLTSNTSCVNTAGTVQAATNSGVAIAPCTGTPDDDVWYRFVTVSTDHTIALSNIGSNLNASGARMQLFSGTCGALTSLACGATTINTTLLARNTTYYIRVYSAGNSPLANNAGFNICVTHPALVTPQIDFGKSFINISKPAGGTVETNDILEIRASVVVRAGAFDSCRFTDVVPAGTIYIPGTLRIITNEGKTYKAFTDAQVDASNDQGWISGTNITMNMGYRNIDWPSSRTRRGRIRNNNGHEPSFYNSSCIQVASYRVQVTAAINTTINIGGGTITYTTTPPAVNTFIFPSAPVAVYPNYGICSNTVGVNSLGTEFNGTFGNGNLKNRGVSANVPTGYTFANFTCGMPQDYYYGIANNTGGGVYSTSNAWPKPDGSCSATPTTHRVFTYWDIIGDHTGATNPIAGNPATDTTGGRTGGYMLIINAAYRIDSAFNHTITGLCPNTYYEISCWMRNICSKCGCDSNGVGAIGAAYIPTAIGDSSGVRPNITFALDGVRYYTSGDLGYNGQWVKKGFTFLTGPSQTSFTMRFYNNAPGGGGNDWALDDIAVNTCSPNMKYSPSINPIVCDSNTLTITDTIRSYFNNYTYYKWQRSTNGGSTWTDVTAPAGPSTPYWNGSAWEYVTTYTVPPSQTLITDSGDLYRVVVATTLANLSNTSCSFTDATSIITLNIIDCGIVLNIKLQSFSGRLNAEKKAVLQWTTLNDDELVYFDIEKSTDGNTFKVIGVMNNDDDYADGMEQYQFTDPIAITGKAWYRIKIRNNNGKIIHSRTIQLSVNTEEYALSSFTNPFDNELNLEINSPRNSNAEIVLMDLTGSVVRIKNYMLAAGANPIVIEKLGSLTSGMYYLRIKANNTMLYRKLVKQ